jgi:hypothetical protein
VHNWYSLAVRSTNSVIRCATNFLCRAALVCCWTHYTLLDTLHAAGHITRCWTQYTLLDTLHAVEHIKRCWTQYTLLDILHAAGHITRCWTHYTPLDTLHAAGHITRFWTHYTLLTHYTLFTNLNFKSGDSFCWLCRLTVSTVLPVDDHWRVETWWSEI